MSFAADEFDAAQAAFFAKRLQHDAKKRAKATLYNVVLILSDHPAWKGVIGWDRFGGRIMKLKPPPTGTGVGEWSDNDDNRTILWISKTFDVEPKPQTMVQAVDTVAQENAYHVVRDYLAGLVWDGKPRVEKTGWLQAYLGAPDTEYHRKAGMRWLISAVARVMTEGCKADHVLILEGIQGLGKSSSLRALFGDWFTDTPLRLGDREASMVVRGCWGVELGELDSLNRAESTSAKQFFSQQDDRYRSPWGRRPQTVARQCVFCGSTNQTVYLKDDTGNRRFWPVECTRADMDDLKADRDQLWAEALVLFKRGEPWWPLPAERAMFEEEQGKRMIGDPFEEKIRAWLENPEVDGRRKRVWMHQILSGALGLDTGRWSRAEYTRVGQAMSRIEGWRHRQIMEDGRREWVYERIEAVEVK